MFISRVFINKSRFARGLRREAGGRVFWEKVTETDLRYISVSLFNVLGTALYALIISLLGMFLVRRKSARKG